MFGRNQTSDKELSKTVQKRLVRAGSGAQTPLAATVQQGTVTLIGILRYESQRRPILKAVSSIAGVGRVIDQLRIAVKPQS